MFCYLRCSLPASNMASACRNANCQAPFSPTESKSAFKIPGDLHAHLSLGRQGLVITDLTQTEEYPERWKELPLQYTSVKTCRDL